MNDIKSAIAKNITELRQAKNMTQLELAEHLNYSDKAVSKWERAESMPDVTVLAQIAELFGVTLDYLIHEEHSKDEAPAAEEKKKDPYNRKVVMGLSLLLVCLLAVFAYVLVRIIAKNWVFAWTCFVYALPVGLIVWLVFNSVWFDRRKNYLIVSLLMWACLACIQISFLPAGINVSLIYLLGVVGQLIILLWMNIRKPQKEKTE